MLITTKLRNLKEAKKDDYPEVDDPNTNYTRGSGFGAIKPRFYGLEADRAAYGLGTSVDPAFAEEFKKKKKKKLTPNSSPGK